MIRAFLKLHKSLILVSVNGIKIILGLSTLGLSTLVNLRRMADVKRKRSEQIGWKRDPLSFPSKTKVIGMFLGEKISCDVKVYLKNLPIAN